MVRVVRPESVVRDSIPSAAHASAFRTIEFARRSTVINMPDDGRAPRRGDRLPITFARECARNAVALKQPAHLLVTGAVETAVDASRRRGAEALVPEVPGPVVEQDIVSPELSALKRQTAPDHVDDAGAGVLVQDVGERDIDRDLDPGSETGNGDGRIAKHGGAGPAGRGGLHAGHHA